MVHRHECNIPGLKNSKCTFLVAIATKNTRNFAKNGAKKSIFHFFMVKAISMKFGVTYTCILLVKMKQQLFKMLNIFQDIRFLISD